MLTYYLVTRLDKGMFLFGDARYWNNTVDK